MKKSGGSAWLEISEGFLEEVRLQLDLNNSQDLTGEEEVRGGERGTKEC